MDVYAMGIADLRRGLRSKEFSATELTQTMLDRIEALDYLRFMPT